MYIQKLVTGNAITVIAISTETKRDATKVACSLLTHKVSRGWNLAAMCCARSKWKRRRKYKDCEVLTLVQHFTLLSGLEPIITLRFSFTFRFLFLGIRWSSGGDPIAGRPNRILTGSFVGEESVFRPCLDSRH